MLPSSNNQYYQQAINHALFLQDVPHPPSPVFQQATDHIGISEQRSIDDSRMLLIGMDSKNEFFYQEESHHFDEMNNLVMNSQHIQRYEEDEHSEMRINMSNDNEIIIMSQQSFHIQEEEEKIEEHHEFQKQKQKKEEEKINLLYENQVKEFILKDEEMQKKYSKLIRCPLCQQQNLQTFEINKEESIMMCPNKKCSFPLKEAEIQEFTFPTKFKKRNIKHVRNVIQRLFGLDALTPIFEEEDLSKVRKQLFYTEIK